MPRRLSKRKNFEPSRRKVSDSDQAAEPKDSITLAKEAHKVVDVEQVKVTKTSGTETKKLTSPEAGKVDSDTKAEDKSTSTVKTVVSKKNLRTLNNTSQTVGDHVATEDSSVKSEKPRKKRKVESEEIHSGTKDKAVKKRKTKEERDSEAMPLATRTSMQSLKRTMYIGAHVSSAGGKHHG